MGVKLGGMSSGNICKEETKFKFFIGEKNKKKQKTRQVVLFLGGITSKTKKKITASAKSSKKKVGVTFRCFNKYKRKFISLPQFPLNATAYS